MHAFKYALTDLMEIQLILNASHAFIFHMKELVSLLVLMIQLLMLQVEKLYAKIVRLL